MPRPPALHPGPAWVLSVAGIVLATITLLWVSMDYGICPPTDSEHHLMDAILFSRAVSGGPGALWETLRHSYVGWPPLSYVFPYGVLGALLGDDAQQMRMYGVALLPLLIWGVYRLGADLADRRTGTMAAVITIFSFGISGQLRQVSIDLPSAVTVVLAMVALVRSRGYSRTGYTLLFGAACGLCFFTRVQSVFFLVGPALGVGVVGLWEASGWRARGRRLGWMLLGAGVALAVSAPWWYGRLDLLWWISTSHLDPTTIAPRGNPGFFPGLWFYAGALGRLNGWLMLGAAGLLLPLVLRPRNFHGGQFGPLILLTWIIGGVLGCTYGVHREARYLLPAVPAVVLVTLLGCRALPRVARSLAAAALALSVVAPTLYFAAHGVYGRDPLSASKLVEWGYVRHPTYLPVTRAANKASRVLYEKSGQDYTGEGVYLLLVQEGHVNYLPRLASYIVPSYRDMAFSFTNNIGMVNSWWHQRQRSQRRVFILSETRQKLRLPLLWSIDKGKYGNIAPIRMYSVPPTHPFNRIVHRRHLLIDMTPRERQKHTERLTQRKLRQTRRKAAARSKKAGMSKKPKKAKKR